MNEEQVFHVILCAVVFAIGFSYGQKRAAKSTAAQPQASTAPLPMDGTSWFANNFGSWGGNAA